MAPPNGPMPLDTAIQVLQHFNIGPDDVPIVVQALEALLMSGALDGQGASAQQGGQPPMQQAPPMPAPQPQMQPPPGPQQQRPAPPPQRMQPPMPMPQQGPPRQTGNPLIDLGQPPPQPMQPMPPDQRRRQQRQAY